MASRATGESMAKDTEQLNLQDLRRRLEEARGPRYWRSLEEIASTEEFRSFVEDEFPNRTPDWNDPASPRRLGWPELRHAPCSRRKSSSPTCASRRSSSRVSHCFMPPR